MVDEQGWANDASGTKGGPAEDELDFFDYVQVLVKYRRMILVVCFLAGPLFRL